MPSWMIVPGQRTRLKRYDEPTLPTWIYDVPARASQKRLEELRTALRPAGVIGRAVEAVFGSRVRVLPYASGAMVVSRDQVAAPIVRRFELVERLRGK